MELKTLTVRGEDLRVDFHNDGWIELSIRLDNGNWVEAMIQSRGDALEIIDMVEHARREVTNDDTDTGDEDGITARNV